MSRSFNYPKGPLPWFSAPNDFTGALNKGIHTTETTQRYIFGTRFLTWDGRVYKYGHAAAECQSGYGAYNLGLANLSNTLAVAASEGDTSLTITCSSGGYAASGVISKDELAGGFIIMDNGVEDCVQMMIIGNDADVSATTVRVDLEWPLWKDLDTSDYIEALLNPFAHLHGGITQGSNGKTSVMGVPCRNLVATYNGWFQTWGPCWITPSSSGAAAPGYTDGDREAYFLAQGNGSIVSGTTAGVDVGNQHAGYIIEKDTAGNYAGPPLIMLQLSI